MINTTELNYGPSIHNGKYKKQNRESHENDMKLMWHLLLIASYKILISTKKKN